jgi:hypothetical protein
MEETGALGGEIASKEPWEALASEAETAAWSPSEGA